MVIKIKNSPGSRQITLPAIQLFDLFNPLMYRLERVCNQDIEYGKIKICKGHMVSIPICAIHRDPLNYENPLKYDPDRYVQYMRLSH